MRKQAWLMGAVVLLCLLLTGSQVLACDSAGPDVHIGEALSVNSSAIQIWDAQTGNRLTFQASAEQLSRIKPGDRVLIR